MRMTRAERIAASPLYRLNGQQAPQLIQCGLLDALVTYDQCQRYAAKAHRAQSDTSLQPLLNAHGQWRVDRERVIRWIKQRWPVAG